MSSIIPPKLKRGDTIRVIAPSKSFRPTFTQEMRKSAIRRLESLGLVVSFGKYVDERDEFESTTVQHRLEDVHDAFADSNVKAILTVVGGTNSNQLLKYLDYDLICSHPKVLCGMSDITALASAIHAKADLITYSGPHFTLFKDSPTVDYTFEYFRRATFFQEPFQIEPSPHFSDKRSDLTSEANDGYWIINEGEAEGIIIGGNLITLNLLQGSEFMPDLTGTVLFVEDNEKENYKAFENHLQALINQPNVTDVRGLVIGRFQRGSLMTQSLLTTLIRRKKELVGLPVIANVDFGHTVPMATFPIGGTAKIHAGADGATIEIIKH